MKLRLAIPGILLVLLSLLDRGGFLQSYVFSFIYWSQMAFGSLALLMVFHLTGGAWGAALRPFFEAGARTMTVAALLGLPLMIGASHLYPWVHGDIGTKQAYLNLPFFYARFAFFFVSWIVIANVLTRSKDGATLKRWSAIGMVFFGFSLSFASFDWVMSLEPDWYSTIYGMIFVISVSLGTYAMLLISAWIYARRNSVILPEKTLIDLGNIALTFVILWVYLSFMQYLIIWSGNLSDEAPWFKHRTQGGWQWLLLIIVLFQFAAPFLILLMRTTKRKMESLVKVAGLLLAVRALDTYWFVLPGIKSHLGLSWSTVAVFLGLGMIWTSVYIRSWKVGSNV